MKKYIDNPLVQRREESFKEDAMEELQEVFAEVKDIEA